MKPLIEMFTFGRFTIRFQEQEIAPPPRHGEALCKALLCQPGRQAEFFWLADELWPEAEGDQAMQYLYVASNAVRSTLPRGILLTHRQMQSYQLVGQEQLWVDADAALDLLAQAQALGPTTEQAQPLLEQAMGYFQRGRFLAGNEESWAHARRSTLVTARERALSWLVRAYTQQNRLSEAERLLATELAQAPHNENLLRSLMQVLHQEGLTYRAIDTYEEFVRALRKVKKQPAEETTELYRQLQRAPRFLELPPLVQATPSPAQQEANGQLPAPGVEAESTRVPVDGAMLYQSEPAFLAPDRFPAIAWGFRQPYQLLDLLPEMAETGADVQGLGEWIVQMALHLGALFDRGWLLDALLVPLQLLLPVIKAMPPIARGTLLPIGAVPSFGSLPLSIGKQIAPEERMQICQAFGESIAAGWKLFHTAGNAEVLALGRAQLFLLQQIHPLLYPTVQPFFSTGTYSLIGIALHFQERYQEAIQAFQSSSLAALATGDPYCIAASLICQADSYHALGQYDASIQKLEEVLRIIGQPANEALVRLKAHALTCWADTAMELRDHSATQEKLEAAAAYLHQLPANEEFDKAGWLLLVGKYALITKDYAVAIRSFEEALAELPQAWLLRRAMTGIGLAMAYARMNERDGSLQVAETLAPVLQTINAPRTNRWFTDYLQQDLLGLFPTDTRAHAFVTDMYRKLPQLANIVPVTR